jgi:glycosyltransferase involved in cell wall biosynthesis
VRPALREGDNTSTTLAMAVGLPVVGFATHAPTELGVHRGATTLVASGDVAALAERVSTLLASPSGRSEMGAAGMAFARAELDIAGLAPALAVEYLAVARGDAGGA